MKWLIDCQNSINWIFRFIDIFLLISFIWSPRLDVCRVTMMVKKQQGGAVPLLPSWTQQFYEKQLLSGSVCVTQTGQHMQPMVLHENSVALTEKHKREHRLEKCHKCHNSADYRSRQCVAQDLDLMRVQMHRFKSNECEANKTERAVSIKR